MKSIVLTAAVFMLATPVLAQDTAMEIAERNNACGENGTIVSARFLDDGRVGVQCQAGAVAASCVPIAAAGGDSDSDLRALRIARQQNACEDRAIIRARFETPSEIRVQCAAAGAAAGDCPPGTVLAGAAAAGAVATNFVPVIGGLFAVVLGAAAVGGSSSTSDTR